MKTLKICIIAINSCITISNTLRSIPVRIMLFDHKASFHCRTEEPNASILKMIFNNTFQQIVIICKSLKTWQKIFSFCSTKISVIIGGTRVGEAKHCCHRRNKRGR